MHPLFFKQNMGLPFLAFTLAVVAITLLVGPQAIGHGRAISYSCQEFLVWLVVLARAAATLLLADRLAASFHRRPWQLRSLDDQIRIPARMPPPAS